MNEEEGHRGGGLGSSRERDAEEHVSLDRDQTNREVQEWKGFKGPGEENIKNYGQQVMSVRTPERFARKSTWQVADVSRPLVSASHIIQAGNNVFIGKGTCTYLICSCGCHPAWQCPSCTRPWRLMQSIKSQMEESRQGESRSTETAHLFDGRSGERGRQVQAS